MKLTFLCKLEMEFWKEEIIWEHEVSVMEEEKKTDLYKDFRQEEDMGSFLIKEEWKQACGKWSQTDNSKILTIQYQFQNFI